MRGRNTSSVPLWTWAFLVVCATAAARADTPVSGVISTDTTWTLAGSPYIVTDDIYVRGASGPTLQIEAGVTVKFDLGKALVIGDTQPGGLQAVGTAINRLTFTANSGTPAPGHWRGIQLYSNTISTSRIAYATVSYGGSSTSSVGGVHVQGSSPSIENTTVQNSAFAGITVYGGSPFIPPSPLLQTVHFENNIGFAMRIDPKVTLGTVSGLTATGNTSDAIELRTITGRVDTSATWKAGGLPYVVTYGIDVTKSSPPVPVLTIEPGVSIRFDSGWGVQVGVPDGPGELQAIGTPADRIIFTANATVPTPGYWDRIFFGPGAGASRLAYATVTYSGDGVSVSGSSPSIENTILQNNAYSGIMVFGGSPSLQTVEISNNPGFAIRVRANVTLGTVSGLTVTGNGTNAVEIVSPFLFKVEISTTWKNIGLPYVVTGDVTVERAIAPVPVLTIEPDVTVRFTAFKNLSIGLFNPGALQAVGTPAQPIIFTSHAATPGRYDWSGIAVAARAAPPSQIAYAAIRYANEALSVWGPATLDHVTFDFNGGGVNVHEGRPSVRNCNFVNNLTGLLGAAAGEPLDARLNWWNAASGPSGGGPGTGDQVWRAIFEPWLTSPASSPQFLQSFDQTNRTFNPSQGIHVTSDFSSTLAGTWTLRIRNPASETVRQFSGSGSTASVAWDGKSGAGEDLPTATYTYVVETTSASGDIGTPALGRVILDRNRPLALESVALTNPHFSPNGDAVKDTTTFSASPNYFVSWNVAIQNPGGNIVRTMAGSGTTLVVLWDGRDQSGAALPDAVYTINASATAGTATVTEVRAATLDVTPPQASITQPAEGSIISNVYRGGLTAISVVGTASDVNLESWLLERTAPPFWQWLRTSATSVTDSELFNWATLPLDNGPYSLRLTVVDLAGNRSTTTNAVTVGNFKVAQSAFQFNSAASQSVTYTSDIPFPLTETLEIKNVAGTTVRTLVNALRSAGRYPDAWNATADAGNLLPDGPYFYIATVTDGTNTLTWDLSTSMRGSSANVAIPTASSPFDPYNNQPTTFAYTLNDSYRTSLHVQSPNDTPYTDCATVPPQVTCLIVDQYQPSGAHTYLWAGTKPNGGIFPFVGNGFAHVVLRHNNFPQNAVVVFGTAPRLTNPSFTPALYGPATGLQTLSVNISSYQNQPVDLIVRCLNQSSLSVLRTINRPGQPVGTATVSWDGRADNGMWVAPGFYTALISAVDSIGNVATLQAVTTVVY